MLASAASGSLHSPSMGAGLGKLRRSIPQTWVPILFLACSASVADQPVLSTLVRAHGTEQ